MRTLLAVAILSLGTLLLASPPVYADTLVLQNKGKVDGSIDEVVLLQNGVEKKFTAGKFTGVTLSKEGKDAVQVDDKATESGEFVSLDMKTVAGILTFKRSEIDTITVTQTSPDEIRKQYLAKRAAVKDDDAAGIYDLALWCQTHNLKAEARILATLCLRANPKPEVETLAHRMVGHVLKDGEWGDAPQPGAETPKDEPAPVAEPKPAGPVTVDPALADLEKKLLAEYKQKTDDTKAKELDAVKTAYKANWDKVNAELKKSTQALTAAEKQRSDLQNSLNNERRAGYNANPKTYAEVQQKQQVDELQRQYDAAKSRLDQLQATIDKNTQSREVMAAKIKATMSTASDRDTTRQQRLGLAKLKIERLLLLGNKLAEADMRAVLEDALKVN